MLELKLKVRILYLQTCWLLKLYPLITWSKLAKDNEEKKEIQVVETVEYIPITINKEKHN